MWLWAEAMEWQASQVAVNAGIHRYLRATITPHFSEKLQSLQVDRKSRKFAIFSLTRALPLEKLRARPVSTPRGVYTNEATEARCRGFPVGRSVQSMGGRQCRR